MITDIDYGRCRACGGPLEVLDTSRLLTVTCVECADTYDLDPDILDGRTSTAYPTPVPYREEGGVA